LYYYAKKGYKYVIIHVSLFEVLDDGVLVNLRQEDHVVHPGNFDILTLPVVHLRIKKLIDLISENIFLFHIIANLFKLRTQWHARNQRTSRIANPITISVSRVSETYSFRHFTDRRFIDRFRSSFNGGSIQRSCYALLSEWLV